MLKNIGTKSSGVSPILSAAIFVSAFNSAASQQEKVTNNTDPKLNSSKSWKTTIYDALDPTNARIREVRAQAFKSKTSLKLIIGVPLSTLMPRIINSSGPQPKLERNGSFGALGELTGLAGGMIGGAYFCSRYFSSPTPRLFCLGVSVILGSGWVGGRLLGLAGSAIDGY
jgi:hypothetical protein